MSAVSEQNVSGSFGNSQFPELWEAFGSSSLLAVL